MNFTDSGELYKIDILALKGVVQPNSNIEVLIKPLHKTNVSFKELLFWNITCMGKIKVYCVYKDNELVHKSFVIKGKAKFPFLENTDIEIGPCWTDYKFRGKGYYPYVLYTIIKNELQDGGIAYMIVDDKNISSLNGIKKVGFIKTDYVIIRSKFKRYYAVKR